ncbi:ABC transporter permease [Metallumcola ferriviriculae]|uniref:Transport permease protein n=1 Tax=Metallumcola ferriviriculae TaxID=3039180 RepID=A0AAU0UJW7_9FIRM|nr:ABC transporter permease [Desulfitibacteraceae bacterium MK1]
MRYFKELVYFINDLINNRKLLLDLTKKDFTANYLGSYLGIIWAFVQPTVTILIFWFVFQVGFKARPVEDVPFILWLMCGMIPWFFFSEGLLTATNSILEKHYLVKNIVFRVALLPIIKIISALFVHLFFIIFLIIMFIAYGYTPNLYYLQLIYYLVATILLVVGLSWITSSLAVFTKDVSQFVNMVLQFGFWLTPIFWSLDMLPERYQFLIKLNPFYYIVTGYRDTLIYHSWFWNSPQLTVYFWAVTFTLLLVGAVLFRRLRPHFADLL